MIAGSCAVCVVMSLYHRVNLHETERYGFYDEIVDSTLDVLCALRGDTHRNAVQHPRFFSESLSSRWRPDTVDARHVSGEPGCSGRDCEQKKRY